MRKVKVRHGRVGHARREVGELWGVGSEAPGGGVCPEWGKVVVDGRNQGGRGEKENAKQKEARKRGVSQYVKMCLGVWVVCGGWGVAL